jgi:D-methionine transport system ATP-binding protein
MISLQDIHQTLEKDKTLVQTLKGITLNVEQGEIFGIIGRRDAGINRLIRCINLLERPSSGKIMIDSVDLTALSSEALKIARRKIGMIFQHTYLLESRNVFDNIALPLELESHTADSLESTVQGLVNLTDLKGKEYFYPYQLSASEKQRVAIARALANNPKILLCEEAAFGLDPKTKKSILQLLKAINQKFNLTILCITHDLNVIKSLCDRVAIFHQGEIIEQDTVLNFLTHPKTTAARDLIKSAARDDLPANIKTRLSLNPRENTHPLLRLSFVGSSMEDPGLNEVIESFDLSIHIIQAHLEPIEAGHIGIMIAKFIGQTDNIKPAIEALAKKNISLEVLGYVS